MLTSKYQAFPPVELDERYWPNVRLQKAPIWCSVDLRDGNQSLPVPMSIEQKLEFFDLLVRVGFKQIEVAFPAASETEFNFVRLLIEENRIPDDVWIQVLTQARPHIIERTFESLNGAKRAIVHLYHSTSKQQRDLVFQMSQDACVDLAVESAQLVKELAESRPETDFRFEYSPESFSLTEGDFAVRICDRVCEVFGASPAKPLIVNLPNTVEVAGPNVYADQVEYFIRHSRHRHSMQISLHTHNDRSCAVAATELALMAGADRVEGTLFGNGERTGNADLVVLALNFFTQGIDPSLDFSDLPGLRSVYETCTGMEVSARQAYAGDLVFTAFSGSHQDAIQKGLRSRKSEAEVWNVPYLPLDPEDIGRVYDPIIRINSQSGKGGLQYILRHRFHLDLPRHFLEEFSQWITAYTDQNQIELLPQEVRNLFDEQYINLTTPIRLLRYKEEAISEHEIQLNCVLERNGREEAFEATGPGLLDAYLTILKPLYPLELELKSFQQHSLPKNGKVLAMSYVDLKHRKQELRGCGISSSVSRSSLRAVTSAVNRWLLEHEKAKELSRLSAL